MFTPQGLDIENGGKGNSKEGVSHCFVGERAL